MSRPGVWFAAALLLAIGAVVYVRCGVNSDERKIRKALRELVEQSQLAEKEDAIKAGFRSRSIGNAFAEDVSVGLPVFQQHIYDRASLVTLVFRARTNLDSVSLKIYEIEVEVAEDGMTAEMTLSFNVKVVGMGASDEMWRDLDLDWRKEDGTWLIAAAEIIETIQRPLE